MEKIVMVDHSYHEKTKSSNFLIDLLKEKYEIELIYDHSWRGGPEPDLSHIDNSYKAVIFWQSISKKMINSVRNKNIIFFPMFDACNNVPLDYWYDIKDVKIISFTKILHEKLTRLGFQSMYIQYYPKPINCKIIKDKSVFFWHRRWEITWNTVKKLLPPGEISQVHIHKAVDPDQVFVSPSESDEKTYKISYSDWFENKEDYYQILKSKSIYIAPRITEGIGFSFLEAMALGKVVIAANNPTMNEYIKHGKNGLLFSPENPLPLQLENIEQMQKNAFESIVLGRKKWESDSYKIFEFIEKKPLKNKYFRIKTKASVLVYKCIRILKRSIISLIPYGIVMLYRRHRKNY